MVVMLPLKKTGQDFLHRCAVCFQESQHRRPTRIQVVTFAIQLLHIRYVKTNGTCKVGLLRRQHHRVGLRRAVTCSRSRINDYLEAITAFLEENMWLLSALKSSVTLFTLDTKQAKTHSRIVIEDTTLPLVQCPKILGVHLDNTLAFHKHCNYVADRLLKRNNVFKAISGATCGPFSAYS